MPRSDTVTAWERDEKGEGGRLLERQWKYGNLVVGSTEVIKILSAPTCIVQLPSFFS